jgi:hypothetical protein
MINEVRESWAFHELDIVMDNAASVEPLDGGSQRRKPGLCSPFVYFNLH